VALFFCVVLVGETRILNKKRHVALFIPFMVRVNVLHWKE